LFQSNGKNERKMFQSNGKNFSFMFQSRGKSKGTTIFAKFLQNFLRATAAIAPSLKFALLNKTARLNAYFCCMKVKI